MSTLNAQKVKHASAVVDNITLGSDGKATLGGQLDLGTIGQIKFPATQNSSADANTLDDYEEGTWTTTVSAAVNFTGTPTLSQATYTKVGRLVTIEGFFSGTVTTSNATTYILFTLPFPQYATSAPGVGPAKEENLYTVGAVSDTGSGNATQVYVSFPANSGLTSGSRLINFSFTYPAST